VCADISHYDLPRCDAVTCIGEVISYAGDAGRVIPRVFRALRPGGVFVFDFAVAARVKRREWWAGEDWAVLLEAVEEDGRLTRNLITFRKRGASWRRGAEEHQLRLYDPAAIGSELTATGFEAHRLRGFGEVRFRSGHAGFAARKPM
jgi:SAM-dependent methyltransferase